MELTPEEKQRIEEEEKRRLAEERYRAEVRARLQQTSEPPRVARVEAEKRQSGLGGQLKMASLIIGLAVVSLIWLSRTDKKRDNGDPVDPPKAETIASRHVQKVQYVPESRSILTGQIVVPAGRSVSYPIQINPEMYKARVTGRFTASGGSGNDISAVLTTEDEFVNWDNGHMANVFYTTHGKKTTDSIDVALGPGSYVLAFSNKFSAFSNKYVFVEVNVRYLKRVVVYE